MVTLTHKYRQAAVAYFIYGVVYLAGAFYLARIGFSERAQGGFAWYLVGVLFVLVFPPLIWRGFKWFTRILAVLLLVRVAGLVQVILEAEGRRVPLPWGATVSVAWGAAAFLVVAAATCFMLARAGWSRPTPVEPQSDEVSDALS